MIGFLIPFTAIALAELGDKTQLSLLLLASRHGGRRGALLAGAMTAFLLVDGIAVALGAAVVGAVPIKWIKPAAGILFILFGLFSLKSENTDEDDAKSDAATSRAPFAAAFTAVLLLEWGDKTQVAAALFAAKFHPLAVLAGALAALAILSAAAIWLGATVASKINKKIVARLAAGVFIAMGVSAFFF